MQNINKSIDKFVALPPEIQQRILDVAYGMRLAAAVTATAQADCAAAAMAITKEAGQNSTFAK